MPLASADPNRHSQGLSSRLVSGGDRGGHLAAGPESARTQGDPVSVLVVDDDPTVARATQRLLSTQGHRVTVASGAREAIEKARAAAFDVILSDLWMPDLDGRALLRAIRANDPDVPFVFLTGSPDLQSAIEAVEYGAFRYLVKPANPDELFNVVARAARWRRLALARVEPAAGMGGRPIGDRAEIEARFASALKGLWIATQPIVSWRERRVLAYEALVRTEEPTLQSPPDLLDAAERLGRTCDLGRSIRRLVADLIPSAPEGAPVFVNLHASDLEDDELCAADGALTPFAGRVTLEITERAAIDGVRGLAGRVKRLRELGFQIAVDDLGAGYAGLSSFAALEPEVVKADMSLVRGIEASPVKQKLVRAIADLSRELGIHMVAEGIETAGERDCLASLGADVLQGYLFARPARGFPAATY